MYNKLHYVLDLLTLMILDHDNVLFLIMSNCNGLLVLLYTCITMMYMYTFYVILKMILECEWM